MQYDKECFSIGTFVPTKENSLESMLLFLETILGSSPQFLKSYKFVSVRNEQTPVLYKQALRAVSLTGSEQEDSFPIDSNSTWYFTFILFLKQKGD